MTQHLNQVPPNLEVWLVDGKHYLVRVLPGSNPPIYLSWFVPSSDEREALGITRVDRTLTGDQFRKTGALPQGTTRELVNTTVDPWDQIKSNYKTEVRVKPWLADPEVLALWLGSALEGRSITEAEFQGTDWWRSRTEAERQWASFNASDPAGANRLIADQRARVASLFQNAGISNATQYMIDTVADSWTSGVWSEVYTANQIRLLADPNLTGDLDPVITGFRDGLDGTRVGEADVQAMIGRWLGPAYADNWDDSQVEIWASRFREDPDARLELEESLKRHRLALFPEYENPNLTYEDIAAPWRGVWSREWGSAPDETNPLFAQIVRMNDITGAEKLLRTEGLAQNNPTVAQNLLSQVARTLGGGQVRRADPAIL